MTELVSGGRLTVFSPPGMLAAVGHSGQAAGSLAGPDREGIMYSDRLGQLASQHHHQMLADAGRRQLQQEARVPRTPGPTSAITRRLSAVLARFGIGTARAPLSETPATTQ
jgi:hypothetical protein